MSAPAAAPPAAATLPLYRLGFHCGDNVRHKASGLTGQLHHWTRGGVSVRLAEPVKLAGFAFLVTHIEMPDGSHDEWEKV